ncbi:MAG: TonB-dependent receptor [Bacteroidota bacterium]
MNLKSLIKTFILALSGFLLSSALIAQVTVSGRAVDTLNVPLPFLNLAILNAIDSSYVNGSTTNNNGEFAINNVMPGAYFLRITAIGYAYPKSLTFTVKDISLNLPDVVLIQANTELNEVSVSTLKEMVQYKDGMIVMNVEDSPLTTGNTVLDLLRRLPGVYIDNQNNIILNGKGGVRIMLDGTIQRLSGQQLFGVLSSMSAEQVSKIEVMSNPPVKYDADGNAGMINIVTKKVKIIGVSGNIALGGSMGHAERGFTDGTLNYKGKNFVLFGNLGFAKRVFYNSYVFDRTYRQNGGITYLGEDGEQINFQEIMWWKLGGDFNLSDQTVIGFRLNGGPSSAPFSDEGVNRVEGFNDLGFDYYNYSSYTKETWSNPGINLNAEHKFDTLGTALSFSGDYSTYSGKRQALSKNNFLNNNNLEVLPRNYFQGTHNTSIDILTLKLDFNKKIRSFISIETGIKGTYVNSRNNYTLERENHQTEIMEIDSLFSNQFRYHEEIMAGYLNFKKEFKKVSVQLGARGEATIVDAKNITSGFIIDRSYFNLFPASTITYTPSDTNSFQFSVSRRIDRPGYRELNPFKSYQDNYSSSVGNPQLIPQTNYTAEFTYSWRGMLHNTITYSRFSNRIMPYDYQDDSTKETISTLGNIKASNYFAYNIFFQKSIKTWLNVQLSGSLFYVEFKGTLNASTVSRSSPGYNANINNEFLLPKDFKLQLSGFYSGPSVNGIQRIKSNWGIDIAMRKTMLKEQLTINVSFLDIFHTNVFNMSSRFQNQDYIFISTPDTQRVGITISYKLGKVKVHKREVESNEQEKSRLGK